MNNPFKLGEPATGDFFIGRDNEISEIVANLSGHRNTAIYGERQIGKSSVLAEIARRRAKDFIFVRIDACAAADENHFLDCYTRETIRAGIGKAWKVDSALWDLLSTRRMRAALSPGGDLTIEDKIRANMPEGIAVERGSRGSSRPAEEKEPSILMCPRCGRPLKWIETYGRHFCYNCKKYAPRQKRRQRSDREWQPSSGPGSCPSCNSDMRYVHRYSDYYCPRCERYPHVDRRILSEPWGRNDMMAALNLPQKLAELKAKPVVVMLDDFQEAADLDDGRLVEAMRLKSEDHEDTTYVFAGNAGESMRLMFEDKSGSFYKFADTVELGRIPDPEMKRFLMSRFRSEGGKLTERVAQRVIGVSEGIPSYAQHIAHELFHISIEPEMTDVEDAIDRVVGQQSRVHALLWDSIRSPLHRRYLFAVAREPGVPHGEAFINRYNLRSRSHVQRIERQLEARRVIKHGEILDPMFVMWLRLSNSL